VSERLDGEFLTRTGNLKEIADSGEQAKSDARRYLGLGDSATLSVGTVQNTVAAGDDPRIEGAMQKNQNGADIPDKAAFIEHIGMKDTINPTKRVSIGRQGDGAFDGSAPCINIGDSDSGFIGSQDGVLDIYCNNVRVGYIDGAGLHMLTDIYTTGALRAGDARFDTNGDVYGTQWGGWLRTWLDSQFLSRDNIINACAKEDWVNRTFSPRNTASLATNGWFRDASTGWIYQWGIVPYAGATTITVNLPMPFPHQGFVALGGPASALWYGEDDASGSAAILNNSQLRVTTDTNLPTAWLAIGN
ncbi:phage tail protein, partial [Salmonella enterica]|nr:phage tail protein [Salmonella enterica]